MGLQQQQQQRTTRTTNPSMTTSNSLRPPCNNTANNNRKWRLKQGLLLLLLAIELYFYCNKIDNAVRPGFTTILQVVSVNRINFIETKKNLSLLALCIISLCVFTCALFKRLVCLLFFLVWQRRRRMWSPRWKSPSSLTSHKVTPMFNICFSIFILLKTKYIYR